MFKMLCGLIILIAVPVSFIIAFAKSIRSGTFQNEKEKQGALFYIGIIPMTVLALVAVIFLLMNKIMYATIIFFVMAFWGLLIACIAEARKRQ